ncbi:type II secretion system F family protein [Vibrio sp. ZSDZ65]|uniref:Type II secretion system F family protein n=1 Tax=Vibrio qingdaonensis TaxID=2829491 RepID=A0A9X3HYE8_9VIBR|nr:type II secretion system F family protein [Vibrio qingdaonensis]MCW8348725.1 type II secretion system F family protein [Vibrio qingdaonensis]
MTPLPLKAQLMLFDQLIGLHSAGLGQKDILLQLQKFGGKSEQTVAKYALNEMGKGLSLAHSLKPFLSELAFQSLLAGESTGHPQQGLEDAKRVLSTQNLGASTLIKAMALPIAISVMLLSVAALCSTFVFPALAEQMPMRRWGSVATFAYQLGLLAKQTLPILIPLLIALGIGITLALPRWSGRRQHLIEHLPLFWHYRLLQSVNLMTALGNQISAGMGVKKALNHSHKNATPYLKAHLDIMLTRISQGKTNIGDVLSSGLLRREDENLLKLMGETGQTGEVLLKSASLCEAAFTRSLTSLSTNAMRAIKILGAILGSLLIFGIVTLVFDIATQFL